MSHRVYVCVCVCIRKKWMCQTIMRERKDIKHHSGEQGGHFCHPFQYRKNGAPLKTWCTASHTSFRSDIHPEGRKLLTGTVFPRYIPRHHYCLSSACTLIQLQYWAVLLGCHRYWSKGPPTHLATYTRTQNIKHRSAQQYQKKTNGGQLWGGSCNHVFKDWWARVRLKH